MENKRGHTDIHGHDSSGKDEHARLAAAGRGEGHAGGGVGVGVGAAYFGARVAMDAPPGFGPARGVAIFIGEPEVPPAFRFSDTTPYRGDPDELPGDPPPPGAD